MLREHLEEERKLMVENLELTIKRGQLLEETKLKSRKLVEASERMKNTSQEVKRDRLWTRFKKMFMGLGCCVIMCILFYIWLFFL